MEIKRPELNIPKLPDLNLETDQKKTSEDKPAQTAQSADVIEVNQAGNALTEAVEAAQQNEGNTGEKGLTDEQQKLISNFHPENEHLEDASFFLKDARSSNGDRNNSGLQLPFMHSIQQSPDQAKLKENAEKTKDLINNQN